MTSWTTEQQRALEAVRQWLADPVRKPVFCLFGYAGTGKTTLAQEIAAGFEGQTAFVAFTGKAALALRQKGCTDAITIHRLLYIPIPRPDGGVEFYLRTAGHVAADLIIVDECSMVDDRLMKDLLSLEIPILAMGDPGQLPPIEDDNYFRPHMADITLQDVQRQAEANPIIGAASRVRAGSLLRFEEDGPFRLIPREDLTADDFIYADQIIVGLNETRFRVNRLVRDILGFESDLPEPGDRLVCLRSHWSAGLVNGSLWRVEDVGPPDGYGRLRLDVRSLDMIEGKTRVVRVHTDCFRQQAKSRKASTVLRSDEFGFGYALTAHKAQGSQWSRVLVIDEAENVSDEPHRWLYTAMTRATESVTIIRSGMTRPPLQPKRLHISDGLFDEEAEKAIVTACIQLTLRDGAATLGGIRRMAISILSRIYQRQQSEQRVAGMMSAMFTTSLRVDGKLMDLGTKVRLNGRYLICWRQIEAHRDKTPFDEGAPLTKPKRSASRGRQVRRSTKA